MKFEIIGCFFLAYVSKKFELFKDLATQILIGLLDASFTYNHFFIEGFLQFQLVTELVEEIEDMTCASLMMGAITPATSLVLICTDMM